MAPDPGIGPVTQPKGHKAGGKKDPDSLGDDPLTSKPSKGRTGVQKFPGTFTVRGTIKMCKDGKITVLPGRGPTIKAEVAADATIDVDTADFRIAQPDDRVTVEGLAKKGQPNMVLAKSIKIELANPLSGAKKQRFPSRQDPHRARPQGKERHRRPRQSARQVSFGVGRLATAFQYGRTRGNKSDTKRLAAQFLKNGGKPSHCKLPAVYTLFPNTSANARYWSCSYDGICSSVKLCSWWASFQASSADSASPAKWQARARW